MIVVISDHAGYDKKVKILKYLQNKGKEFIDLGTTSNQDVDFPDFVDLAVKEMRKHEGAVGIFMCGTGNGMCIAANKYNGVIATLCPNAVYSKLARAHNNANVLCLPSRLASFSKIKSTVDAFLTTQFLGDKYARRNDKIASYYIAEVKRIKG